jgi:hypothetical protein
MDAAGIIRGHPATAVRRALRHAVLVIGVLAATLLVTGDAGMRRRDFGY